MSVTSVFFVVNTHAIGRPFLRSFIELSDTVFGSIDSEKLTTTCAESTTFTDPLAGDTDVADKDTVGDGDAGAMETLLRRLSKQPSARTNKHTSAPLKRQARNTRLTNTFFTLFSFQEKVSVRGVPKGTWLWNLLKSQTQNTIK